MTERGEFTCSIPKHQLEKMVGDAVSELEKARAKEAVAYCFERFGQIELRAVKLRGNDRADRRFDLLTDDRRGSRKYSYLAISVAIQSALSFSGKETKNKARTALIDLEVGESLKIRRKSD